MIFAEWTVLLAAALATGGLMVNWIGLARAMSRLSSSAYVEFHQHTNRTFDPYMPIVLIVALLSGLGLAVAFGLDTASGRLCVAGTVSYIAVLAVSLATNVPINRQIAGWSSKNPPNNWATVRARWVRFHVLRTLVSLPALVFYLAAVTLRTV